MNYTELAETVTAKIVAKIEAGAGAWAMPWHAQPGLLDPRNATTGNGYQGVNWLMLAMEMSDREYPTNVWATFKQWEAAGAQVRKGCHGTQIVKWVVAKGKTMTDDDGTVLTSGGDKLVPKVYYVFNAAQVDGWTPPTPADQQGSPLSPAGVPSDQQGGASADQQGESPSISKGDVWIAATGATIHEGNAAYYRAATDDITLPAASAFFDQESRISTTAHELVHWTAHTSRLGRDLSGRFGSDAYAAEELVAELGAAMACALLGVASSPRDDHAAYLAHWLRILRADPKSLFATASAASKAVAHLDAYSMAVAV